MAGFTSTVGPQHVFPAMEGRRGAVIRQFPARYPVHDSLSVPNRGMLWGGLLSGFLWVVVILLARELWLFLR